jgi:hypothetical protein
MSTRLVYRLASSYHIDDDLILDDHDRKDLVLFIHKEYQQLRRMGITVILSEDDPYSGYDEMMEDVLLYRRLKVYIGGTDSPILTHHQNVMFRAVHDYHHVLAGADFTIGGEIKAFQHVARLTDNQTLKRFFFSEIVLQAATFYATGSFPKQRIVDSPLMPHFLNQG